MGCSRCGDRIRASSTFASATWIWRLMESVTRDINTHTRSKNKFICLHSNGCRFNGIWSFNWSSLVCWPTYTWEDENCVHSREYRNAEHTHQITKLIKFFHLMHADYAFELRWVWPSHKTIIAANRFNLPFFLCVFSMDSMQQWPGNSNGSWAAVTRLMIQNERWYKLSACVCVWERRVLHIYFILSVSVR